MTTEPDPITYTITAKIEWTNDPVLSKIIPQQFQPIDIINKEMLLSHQNGLLLSQKIGLYCGGGYYQTGYVLRAEFSDGVVWEYAGKINLQNSSKRHLHLSRTV